ncbi:MAG: DUF971 domain-containing protein [Planctomycetota bacterium]
MTDFTAPISAENICLAPTSELLVLWADGLASVYDPVRLRRLCPCADCRDLRQKAKERPRNVLGMARGPAPEEVAAVSWAKVGNYAIALRWQDGHDTGIYTFRFLRQLAESDEDPE